MNVEGTDSANAGHSLVLSARFGARDDRQVSLVLELQTVGPRGDLVARSPVTDAPLDLRPGSGVEFTDLRTPPSLPDGYYRTLLVYGAASNGRTDEGFEEVFYEIGDGRVEVLEAGVWRQESGANMGVHVPGSELGDPPPYVTADVNAQEDSQ